MSGQQIERPATVVRRQRAVNITKPGRRSPSADPIANGATPKRGRRATLSPKPNEAAPVVRSTQRPAPATALSRTGTRLSTKPSTCASPATTFPTDAAIVTELVNLQRTRVFCITSQSRCDRSIESFIASAMGFRIDATEKDRKSMFARAKAYRLAVEAGGEGHGKHETHSIIALAATHPMILTNAMSRAGWDTLRANAERTMEHLVTRLPVWPFAQSVRGLGARGLAILVAECGIPMGDYRTVSGIWKRLGLAVIGGERQRKKTNVADAAAHGYSPRRRAQVWAVCSDSLFRAQWRGEDEEAGLPARPIGPYGEVYAKRRAATLQRHLDTEALSSTDPAKWSKGRCHNDARRIMTKQLVIDLYVAWKNPEHRRLAA